MKGLLDIRGFTLVELMIVVAIIGVLIVFATMGYNAFRDKAKKVMALAELKNIQLVVEDLAFDTDRWTGYRSLLSCMVSGIWRGLKPNHGRWAETG
jgi:prepilin-type N-terminal cleavage/methylation domain-containing protein